MSSNDVTREVESDLNLELTCSKGSLSRIERVEKILKYNSFGIESMLVSGAIFSIWRRCLCRLFTTEGSDSEYFNFYTGCGRDEGTVERETPFVNTLHKFVSSVDNMFLELSLCLNHESRDRRQRMKK